MAISAMRTVIIFSVLMLFMRLMGKRQLGELEPSELVVAVLLSDIASNPIQDSGIPLVQGLVPVTVLFCCEVLISGLTMKSVQFRKFFCGKPCILIEHGKIVQGEMRKNRFTVDELYVELRKNGIYDISIVKYAVLETDGKLSLLIYSAESPVTPKQMGILTDDQEYPIILINDGKVLTRNLQILGHDDDWLREKIAEHGAGRTEDVYLMTADRNGQVYYAAMEKRN